MHDHENFRWKLLKGNWRGRTREGTERVHLNILARGPRVPPYATGYSSGTDNYVPK